MKLGVHIGYWGLGLTADEQLELVLEAEKLGYDSVWTAEAYGSDALTPLASSCGAATTISNPAARAIAASVCSPGESMPSSLVIRARRRREEATRPP